MTEDKTEVDAVRPPTDWEKAKTLQAKMLKADDEHRATISALSAARDREHAADVTRLRARKTFMREVER